MSDEQLHYAISQYVDGTLPHNEVVALEKRLQGDSAARRLLDEYRRIGDLIQVALPEPEMDWDKFSVQISAAVDRQGPPVADSGEDSATAYRIGIWRPLALAAGILLCVTVAVVLLRSGDNPADRAAGPVAEAAPPQGPKPPEIALVMNEIEVLTVAVPEGEPVLQVQIGPARDRKIRLTDLYPEMASDYRPSISIAGDPKRLAVGDEFGMIQ